ncbi:riboflavin synthase [Dokdonella sp.]|uniref:riboflavin synthase n=1 Tax=Dokdonella sp. TaxID=2291710 RepID=UPI001B2D8349|nr:riboflavin synthase [Dokdonella sp.]MBO9665090.1 riboflavin synthase [Dokdonella sp.]
MFTGIIQAVGRIAEREQRGGDARIVIEVGTLDLADVALGDSIAVAGVCLTAVELAGGRFAADVSAETLRLTTLGALAVGDAVNLEKSLRLADRLGGHLVSGHVDGVGAVVAVRDDGGSQRWTFRAPAPLARYIAVKGSICVDGTSLTVNEAGADTFGVTLIPHTLAATTFGSRKAGDAVNLEVDLIARYVERLYGERGAHP